ncbi:MAG: hypothetical protein GC159_09845 [Phycisphaera sp.]|nr:hypothetical protein [Phycisphaera sp.]
MTDPIEEPPRGVSLQHLRRVLWAASILYLAIPVAIFCAGWLRPVVAAVFVAILAGGVGWWLRELFRPTAPKEGDPPAIDEPRVTVRSLLLAAIPVMLALLICGSGGWGLEDVDWLKHNAVLMDLIRHDWPVTYYTTSGPVTLVYYVAYYLPAAVVGKLFGWTAANHTLWLTTVVGTMIALGWFILLTRGRRPVFCSVVFVLFSGMDVIGQPIVPLIVGAAINPHGWEHIEWWSGVSQCPSTLTQLFWTPQHAVTSWLCTAMTLDAIHRRDPRFPGVFLLAMGLLWSPMVIIGLAPFIALQWFVQPGAFNARLRTLVAPLNLTGVILGGLLVAYFLQRAVPFDIPKDYDIANPLPNGFVLTMLPVERIWLFLAPYALFVVLEFALLIVACFFTLRRDADLRVNRVLLAACLALMTLAPLYRYGYFNDLAMRGSMPALFIVAVFAAAALTHWDRHRIAASAIALMLAIGVATPAIEIRRHLTHTVETGRLIEAPAPETVDTLFTLQKTIGQQFDLARQYLGSTDTPFYQVLSAADPDAAPRPDEIIK